VPGDKVATGWREGIELLKLTGLLGKPDKWRSLRARKKFRTATIGGDECGMIKSLTNILKRRNRFPHIVTRTAKEALNPLDWVSRSQKRNRAR